MTDFRLETFLHVCGTLNYTVSAAKLGLTQPAVSQHIEYLEKQYGTKLFDYAGKRLSLTEKGKVLERYALSVRANENHILRRLQEEGGAPLLRLAATKTVGEYVIAEKIARYINCGGAVSLTVDNTQNLLAQLDKGEIDLALMEGTFDKSQYFYARERTASLTGICACSHSFAGKAVEIEELLQQRILIREKGSGTRNVLENVLHERGLDLRFSQTLEIGNFNVMKKLVRLNLGVAIVYEEVLSENADGITKFSLKNCPLMHDFDYVALKDSFVKTEIDAFIRIADFDSIDG